MKTDDSTVKIQLKAYSLKELSALYKVSEKVFRNWLKPFEKDIGKKVGRLYTPKQAKIIFEKIGIPEVIHLK